MGCACSARKFLEVPAKEKRLTLLSKGIFVVNGLIGAGGFGQVLVAMLATNKKLYALKEISKANLCNKHKSGITMLFGELSALKRLNHSFIISLSLAFQDVNHCYFALDLKTGGDLRYYLKKRLLFEERDVAFYVSCISSALEHIHSRNIIHRDIKPENIILDERGFPHLADFGVAHVQACDWDVHLTSNLASGTKQYLAPEVFTRSHVHGPESDYWSLAVVAYELLYGKRPFEKHCNIQFINYLERGLSLKRRQIKEQKIKEMTTKTSNTNALSCNDVSSSSEGCGSSSSTCQQPGSPERCTMPPSPGSPMPPLSPSPSLGCSTSRDPSSRHFFPAINLGAASSDSHGDQQQSTPSFCSSNNYSASSMHFTGSSSVGRHDGDRRGGGGGGIADAGGSMIGSVGGSRCSSRGSSIAGTELEVSSESVVVCRLPESAGRLSPSARISLSPVTSQSSVTGGAAVRSNQHQHDQVQQQQQQLNHDVGLVVGCAERPRRCESASTTQEGPLPPVSPRLEPRPIDAPLPAQTQMQQAKQIQHSAGRPPYSTGSSTTEAASESDRFQGPCLLPGDHWVVDDDLTLSHELRVYVPNMNDFLGKMTPACVNFLRRMFDIRPSHRMGCRDTEALRTHPWLAENGVSDWDRLQRFDFEPYFQPGKRFVRDVLCPMGAMENTVLPGGIPLYGEGDNDDRDDETYDTVTADLAAAAGGKGYGRKRAAATRYDDEEVPEVTSQQQRVFTEFHYVAPQLRGTLEERDLQAHPFPSLSQAPDSVDLASQGGGGGAAAADMNGVAGPLSPPPHRVSPLRLPSMAPPRERGPRCVHPQPQPPQHA